MSFGWSVSDVALAAKYIWIAGEALSETYGAPKRVKEDMAFIKHLMNTFENVEKAVDDSLLPVGLRKKIEAIRGPLLETTAKMVGYHDLTKAGNKHFNAVMVRSVKKIVYCWYFSTKIRQLRDTIAIPLEGLHLDLTLLSVERLQTTQQTVEERFDKSQQAHHQELLRRIKEWLRPVSTVEDTYNAIVTNLLPGTCKWLFVKKEYLCWWNQVSRKELSILWISGIPGAGKTNLAAKIIQKFRQEKRAVAYFFCDGTAHRDDAKSIMSTLCWQLLNQFPEDVELLLEAYERGGEPIDIEMRDCLGRMCVRRDALIVLDGLDECALRTRKQLCMLLVFLVAHSNVIILSRELDDIQQGLSQVPEPFRLVRIEISESDTESDLKRLIVEESKQLGVLEEETRREIVQRLQSGCHGMFQWVTNMIAYLMDSERMIDEELLSKTEEMPAGLNELYSKILGNIHKDKPEEVVMDSMSVLSWVACSRRALSLPEIAMMLRIKNGATRQGWTVMAEHAVLRRIISKYCGPLVRFVQRENKEVVVLAHASVKEFLFSHAKRESKAPIDWVKTKIETDLARICLTYLCFEDIESPPFQITENTSHATLESKFRNYLKRYPLMTYATAYAWSHASVSGTEEGLVTAIEKFCSSETVTVRWLQVFLQLCGDRGVARSSNALDYIDLIEKACKMKDESLLVNRWLCHLRGPHPCRFSRWGRFVTSGNGNDFLPAIHVAAFFDFEEYVRAELGKGINPNELSIDNQTPLHLSARGDSVGSGRVLVDHGADVNSRGYLGTTPICCAITDEDDRNVKEEGPFEMARFLLECNVNLVLGPRSASEAPGPLTLACRLRQPDSPYVLDLVQEMLKRGASVHIDGYPGRKPLLTSAIIAKSPGLVDLLLTNDADPNGGADFKGKEKSNFNHPLIAALRSSPSELIVEKLIEFGADPNVVGCYGRTALHLAAGILCPQVASKLTELLLENGSDCNIRSDNGSLPLHEATKFQNLGAMKGLIARHERSQLDAEDGLGRTPLTIAIENDFKKGIRLLLDAGCATENNVWRIEHIERGLGQTESDTRASYRIVKKQATHFPRHKKDQYRVYVMLCERSRLPTNLARKILDIAEYWIKSTVERCEELRYDEDEAKKQTPYLLSDPIKGAHSYPVREINIIICSHDQGWSNYKDLHGTYIASMTFFNLVVQTENGSLLAIEKGVTGIIHNVHACSKTREHFVTFKYTPTKGRQSWLCQIKPGDRIGVVPMALCSKWVNHVQSARIEVLSTFMLNDG